MAKPDKANRPKGRGRENAPGQNKTKTFVHQDTGDTVTGTMNDFHATLKDQGYRPADEVEAEDIDVVDDAAAEDGI